MDENQKRVVLKESVSRKDIEIVAWDNDWVFEDEIIQGKQNPYEVIWTVEDEQNTIHYIEDFLIQVNYILARGQDSDLIIQQVCSSLATYGKIYEKCL